MPIIVKLAEALEEVNDLGHSDIPGREWIKTEARIAQKALADLDKFIEENK